MILKDKYGTIFSNVYQAFNGGIHIAWKDTAIYLNNEVMVNSIIGESNLYDIEDFDVELYKKHYNII